MINDKHNDLIGLVLIGGKSKRMNQDKARISYHGKEQYQYCYELLEKFCDQVYLSVRDDQKQQYCNQIDNFIIDNEEYGNSGPLSGILSAMEQFSNHSILVLACDLPNVNEGIIEQLLAQRSKDLATAFKSSYDGLPEPLCAVYEKGILPVLRESFNLNILCPRKILINAQIQLIDPENRDGLMNINRPQQLSDYQNGKQNYAK